jgi:hypothetical protein
MFIRLALSCLAALALASPALAACTNNWVQPSAQTLAVNDGTEFRITRFANHEAKLSLLRAGQPVEVLFTRGIGYLVKGVPEPELRAFAQDAHWLTLIGAPALSVLWDAVKVPPCSASGTYDIAQDIGPNSAAERVGDRRLRRATGQAVADGKGLIRYTLRFDTEPAMPPGQTLSYAGTLSFLEPGEAMPDDTAVGGFSVVSPDRPSFVAAPGITLSQLRAQLATAR